MRRILFPVILLLATTSLYAQNRALYRARNAMDDLRMAAGELGKETTRHAQILGLLVKASRSLEDWQKNNAMAEAWDSIGKAEQLSNADMQGRMRIPVVRAKAIVEPLRNSPTSADLPRARSQLRADSVERARLIVAQDLRDLTALSALLHRVNGDIADVIAQTSQAMIEGGE